MSQGHEEQATALAQEVLQLAERSGDHVQNDPLFFPQRVSTTIRTPGVDQV
jgi:hypothetical protein